MTEQKMTQIEITLTDTYGKTKTFAQKMGRNGLVTKPISTERGFGSSHTDYAEIDGFTVSGDMWRFFEGTLGVESLHEALTANSQSANELLESFEKLFKKTSDDDDAFLQWTKFISAYHEHEVLA